MPLILGFQKNQASSSAQDDLIQRLTKAGRSSQAPGKAGRPASEKEVRQPGEEKEPQQRKPKQQKASSRKSDEKQDKSKKKKKKDKASKDDQGSDNRAASEEEKGSHADTEADEAEEANPAEQEQREEDDDLIIADMMSELVSPCDHLKENVKAVFKKQKGRNSLALLTSSPFGTSKWSQKCQVVAKDDIPEWLCMLIVKRLMSEVSCELLDWKNVKPRKEELVKAYYSGDLVLKLLESPDSKPMAIPELEGIIEDRKHLISVPQKMPPKLQRGQQFEVPEHPELDSRD